MRRAILAPLPFLIVFAAAVPGQPRVDPAQVVAMAGVGVPEPGEDRPGGAATSVLPPGIASLSQPPDPMPEALRERFLEGRGLFRKLWKPAPDRLRLSDGLGPIYNARACQICHVRDGRGRVPEGDPGGAVSLFLRLSVPEARPALPGQPAVMAEPVYGGQLQNFALPGVPVEGRMTLSYAAVPVTLAGGEVVTLRRPTYGVTDLAHGPLAPGTLLSPRLTPPMTGLGLIEAIPEAGILARADPGDLDGDGISGRPNLIRTPAAALPMLGRFGWKAGNPTLRQQAADAFAHDMGLSSPPYPDGWGDCSPAQTACREAPRGGDPVHEIDDMALDLVTFYSANLAVPARRAPFSREVLAGKRVFHAVGCPACHVPRAVTGAVPDAPWLSGQVIWPYSDFLLHDMGEGLADGRPEGVASGREWRTPPLWGIGLAGIVSDSRFYLHDGRARSLIEAILWHGGEAAAARDRVVSLPAPDRADLLAFLDSL